MEVRRIGPGQGLIGEIKDLRKRIQTQETRPAGSIVIRETMETVDPETGVKTIFGQLPDGSVGIQPFVYDITPPPVASAPIVTADPGVISISWDGLFAGAGELPRDFECVNIIGHKMNGTITVSSTPVGMIRRPLDFTYLQQDIVPVGETWQFSLESEDYNGNRAAWGARSASVVMKSVVTDAGVNDALAEVNNQVISAQSAAVSAQNAADTAQAAADGAAQAALDAANLADSKGVVYTQSTAPSADYSGLWIDTAHNNIPRRFLGVRKALVVNAGGGASVQTRLTAKGWSVSAISTVPAFEDAVKYDLVALDAGYAGLGGSYLTLVTKLHERGISLYTSGNDTTSLPPLFTGGVNRGTPKNNIDATSNVHGITYSSYADGDLNYYLTGVNSGAVVTGTTLVASLGTNQPINIVMEHPTNFSRWVHIQTYATPAAIIDLHLDWLSNNWVAIQDQGVISAASAAASAQNKADQAFNNAATAASAAGTAQSTADGKNTNWYQPTQPAGTGHKVGDTWFDTDDNYKLRTWSGSVWQTTQDSALAQQIAESKALVYTQPTTPPLEARVASTIWNDTSLGLNNIIVKHWNGTAWTALVDKATTDAAAVADSKGETIYSTTEPPVAKRLPQNLWVDTTGGINIHKRWDGNAWVVAADSRIASSATAVTAAQATADAKSVVYTQPTTPPVEARLPQTLWNDTSLGLDKIVVKYWNGSAWTSLADKAATDAAAVAATKTKTYFQTSSPALTGNTTGDIWFDTDDGNKAYVWDGGAWAVAQDSSINKSLFGTFPTDIDQTQPNKWLYTRYNKTTAANTIPSYLDIVGVAGTSSTVSDSAQLVVNVGEQYIGQLRTIVYVSSTTSIPVTATHDDGAQIYVDGVSIYTSPVYTANAKFTLSLSAGWHVVDYLWAEQAGGDGFSNVTPLLSTQVSSMFAPVSLSATSQAVSAAQTSANTAMSAQSYSTNASFDDWTGTYPTGYTFWNSTPIKETTIVRRAPNAIRFNVADTTAQSGVAYASILSHAPNLEYYTVELEFYLVSGGLGQAGMILDWGGLTPNRAQINLFDEVPSAATGKWYRVVKTLRRPTSATGTFTSMNGYLMGQWSGHTGGGAAKNIIFDWFNIRPASAEEILAFNSTTVAQTKADAAQAAAITAAQATTMLATAYSKNPSFDDWSSTLPDTYSAFGAITPTKDTTNKRIGAHGLKFTVPGTEDAGINFVSNVSHMPNVEYITVELEFMLTSGTLAGAGVLLDWNGLTPIRSLVKLTDHVLTPVTGKWYRISAVVARPANATGTWTSMGGWLMANWNELGTKVAKTITYDWLNVRPSTAEEITAYKAPAKYTELSGATTTAQQSADGKNKVHYSTSAASGTTDPTDNNRPFVEGDTWYQRDTTTPTKIIAQWEFTGGAWVSRKITGLVLTEVDAGTITVGYLRGENLSATAIDGKTITGALIQTDSTPVSAARGIKLTSTELAGYDAAGVKNFSLTSGGTLAIRGAIQSGSTIDGTRITGTAGLQTHDSATAGVKMTNAGIKAWDGSNNLTFHLDATTGMLEVPGIKANSINGDRLVADSISVEKLLVESVDNLISEPTFTAGGISWGVGGAFSIDPTGARNGGPAFKIVNAASQQGKYNLPQYIRVEEGQAYRMTAYIKSDVSIPVNGVSLYASTKTAAGAVTTVVIGNSGSATQDIVGAVPANTWTRITGTYVIPAGNVSISFGVFKQAAFSTGNLWIDFVSATRMSSGSLIVDGAIDGKTITGALIQTDNTPVGTSASRGIKLTSTELAGYDTAGLKNFSLTSAGALTIVGAIQSGGTISGTQVTGSLGLQTSTSATAGVKMNNQGIVAYDGSNNMTFKLDATTGYLEIPGIKTNSLKGDVLEAGSVVASKLLISSTSNAIVDPAFQNTDITAGRIAKSTGTWVEVAGTATVPKHLAHTTTTTNDLLILAPFVASSSTKANAIPVVAGQKWLLSVEVETNISAGVRWNLHRWHSDDTFTYVSASPYNTATGKRLLSYVYDVPAGVVAIYPSIACNTSGVALKVYGNLTLIQQAGATLIENNSISTGKIAVEGLDGGVITAQTLTAVQMKGKSITVDKLVVSSTDNLIVEADFGNGGASWGTLNANKAIVATAGRGSLPALRVTGSTALQTLDNLVNRVTVGTEDRFRGSMYVKSSVAAASGVAKLRMKAYTTATAFTSLTVATSQALTAGAWTLVEGYSPALPANTIAIEFFLEVQNAATGTTLDIDYVGMTRAADGKLVIDGAIDGKTITGALFQTDNSPLDSTASRGIKLNSSGLKAYSPTGVKTFGIDALTGEVSSSGTFATTSSEYVEGSGTMTIGAIFGNLTYNSHTEYSGIPGIKFTRTHSSEGVKPPASILYDGKTINLSTYPDDNGFTPNTAGSHIGVGEGTVTMGASRNGAVGEDYIPSPSFELHGGTVAGPGYEKISQVMSSKPSTDWMHVGLEIENYRGTGVYNKFTPFSARLFNRSNQYQGTKLGVTEMAVHDGGRWEIKGSRHSDGVLMSSLSSDVSGNFRLQAESVRIGNAASNLNEITINPGPGIVMKGQTRIVGDLTMDTNSGQWGGIVDAAGYKINGQVMSGGEVQTWDVSGVMPNAAIPVPKVGLPLTNAAKSTSQSLASTNASNPGELTIINSAVYDITFSYGQTGGTTADRSFIEVKLSGNDRLLGRASIANGEDSASCTVTGVRLDAGAVLLFEVYQNSGGSKNYSSRITIKRAASPVPVTAWEVGNKVVEGNLSVSGSINQGAYGVAPVRYYQSDIVVSYPPNGTLWGPGVFVKNESASIGGDFITIPLNDQFRVTQAGVYDFEFQFYLKYVGGGQPRALLQRQVGGSWETLAAVQRPENTALWEFNLRRRIHCAANDLLRLNFIQSSGATQQWDTQMTVAKIG